MASMKVTGQSLDNQVVT